MADQQPKRDKFGREIRQTNNKDVNIVKTFDIGTTGVVRKVFNNMEYAWRKGFPVISAQGGTRSGKTRNIMIWCVWKCFTMPNMLIGITRKTSPTIYGTVFQDFKDVMVQIGRWNPDNWHETHKEYNFGNGSIIRFFPCDMAAKQKGRKNTIVWCNEATELAEMDFNQLNLRAEACVILDYNPDYEETHWLNKVNESKDTHFFITTYQDNKFLEPRIISQIEALRVTNPSLWKMYGEGKRCKVEGLIYQNYQVIEHFPLPGEIRGMKLMCGIDFGFSADPTAIVLVGITANAVYVDEICYRKGMYNRDIAEALHDPRVANLPKVSDNSEPKTISELKTTYHIRNLKPVNKGGRTSHDARKASINRLQARQWFVTAKSTNILHELGSYCFKIDSNGNPTNEPIEFNDHGLDAVRYTEMSMNHVHTSIGVLIRG